MKNVSAKSKVKSKKSKLLFTIHCSLFTLCLLFTVHCSLITAQAQSTEFTYQGRLLDNTLPPTGNYDFQFSLWESLVAGPQAGTTQTVPGVPVTNGIFTVKLDFGAQFDGSARFLQIAVRPAGGGAYTTLAPRQSITSAPYAVRSLNSTTADTATNATTANNALNLGGVAAADYVVTTDPRMTDARTPTAGSANYIQNQNAGPQSSSDFNIAGMGTANIFNAAMQYNIGADRILSTAGFNNLFAGVGAGAANPGGQGFNSFFGRDSGQTNTDGSLNSFFGARSGRANTVGNDNSFFGFESGRANETGSENSFFGLASGISNTSGIGNSFFGRFSGNSNTIGNNNTSIGHLANVGAGNLTNASAFGSWAFVTANNSLVLGSIAGVNLAPADTNVGIGTTAPTQRLHVVGNALFANDLTVSGTGTANIFNAATQYNIAGFRILSNAGTNNIFAGVSAGAVNTGSGNSFFGTAAGFKNATGEGNALFGQGAGFLNETGNGNAFFGTGAGSNTTAGFNSFFGSSAGGSNQTGGNNAFFGKSAGFSNTTGGSNTIIGDGADVTANNLVNATALGSRAAVGANNSLVLGSINGVNGAIFDTNVGIGTTTPTQRLHVVGNALFANDLTVSGTLNANLPAGSITSGTLGIARGGTGLSSSGAAGNYLRSDGTNWTSSALQAGDIPGGSGSYIQNQNAGAQSSSNFNIDGTGTANIFSATQYNIGGGRVLSIGGVNNTFVGVGTGASVGIAQDNSSFGWRAGEPSSGSANSFFGSRAGFNDETGIANTMIGAFANPGANNLQNATAIGFRAFVTQNSSLVLGSINGVNGAGVDTNVGIGTTAPQSRLQVNGTGWFSGDTTPLSAAAGSGVGIGNTATSGYLFGFDYATNIPRDMTINLPGGNVGIGVAPSDKLHVGGIIRVDTLGAAGSTQLCHNASNQIATCSSSLKYKTNVARFSQGMSFVNKLSPISYNWKDGGMKDVGFGAEDIAKIDPRFVTYNANGEVEGVKYDRLSVAFVNAFKEQQAAISGQQSAISELRAVSSEQAKEIAEQKAVNQRLQAELDALKELICAQNPTAEICQP